MELVVYVSGLSVVYLLVLLVTARVESALRWGAAVSVRCIGFVGQLTQLTAWTSHALNAKNEVIP